jgi:hypothetical protein
VRRADDPRLQPIVWIVFAGTLILLMASGDSIGERLAMGAVFAVLLAIYVLVILPRRRG